MERPFDAILGQVYSSLEKIEKNIIFNFNQNDKILVWIVGFSITAITLIISKISDLSNTYDDGLLKTALLLLIITVISGIVYRFSALTFLNKFQGKMFFFLEGAFSKEKTMSTEVSDLNKVHDIRQLYQKIKSDYDFDYSDIVNLHNEAETNESKEYYINYLKNENTRIGEWARGDYQNGIKYVKNVYKNTFGLSEKTIERMFQGKNETIYFKFFGWICIISMSTCIISFLSVLILLAYNYN